MLIKFEEIKELRHGLPISEKDAYTIILNNMNEGKATGAIFLDLKKAFDTINHSLLIKKLNKCVITGSSLKWFVSNVSGRSQAVNTSSSLSDFKNIGIGIPQGTILGPLLFVIFVNSLPNCVNCKTIMYADDTTHMCSSNDASVLQSELNEHLSKTAPWFKENHLTLNIEKKKNLKSWFLVQDIF